MPIRRALILWLLTINQLTLVGLLVYVGREDSLSRRLLEAQRRVAQATRQELVRGALDEDGRAILEEFSRAVEEALTRERAIDARLSPEARDLRLLLAVRRLPILAEDEFHRLVEHAVLLRLPTASPGSVQGGADPFPRWFNLSPELIFPTPVNEQSEPREFVRLSIDLGNFYGEGRRIAGPLSMRGEPWGGFYLWLRGPVVSPLERIEAGVSPITVLLLLAPALLAGPFFLWRILSRRVIAPLEEIAGVAESVAKGDYRMRLVVPAGEDEVRRTMRLLNEMLDLVQDYRDTLEDRVRQKSEELERRQTELRLAQRLAATGTLAAGIAHEINNPLAGMVNIVRRLGRIDLDPERRARYLAVLEENIERIGAIVRRVLEVSPRRMVPVPLDLRIVLQHAGELVHHRAKEREVRIATSIPAELPQVLGEANELGQVALNLLINAIDASPIGSEVQASLRATEDGRVCMEIEDRGEGMDAATRDRAFDLFFTTKGTKGGTGLGLALVRGIIEGHAGSIELDSAPGHGTRARVWLPAVPETPRSDD